MPSPQTIQPHQTGRPAGRRAGALVVTFVVLLGAVLLAPTPSFAATPVTHIDDVALTLAAPAPTGPSGGPGAGAAPRSSEPSGGTTTGTSGESTTSTTADPAAPPATLVDPESVAGRQAQATRPDRVTATAEGVRSFNLIGLSIRVPDDTAALVRVHTSAGWGDWQELELDGRDGPDPDSDEARRAAARTGGIPVSAPIWVGAADGYEVSAPAGSSDATVHLAREEKKLRRVDGTDAGAVTAPDLGRPAIASRASWRARDPKEAPSVNPTLRLAVVHHSVTANDYGPGDVPGILRSIQAFHMDANGWNDIAYNFAVDKYGKTWETRAGGVTNAVQGGHAMGANFESVGVVALGDFTSVAPSQAMVNSIGALIGWKLYIHGSDPAASVTYEMGVGTKYPEGTVLNLSTIVSHRDVGATGCPGDRLYARLGDVRTVARQTYDWLRATPGLWPDVVTGTNADGRLEQFAVGNDQQVWHAWQTASGWSTWLPLGGRVSGRLAVGRNADGRLEVFAAGVSGGLWHIWQVAPNGGWSGAYNLGGRWSTTIGVAAATNTDGRQEVFVVGDHGGVWRIAQVVPNGGWGPFASLGGSHPSDSSIVAGRNADGRLEVFTIGDAHDVLHAWQDGRGGWSGTWSIGGSVAGELSLVRNVDGRLELVGIGTGGGLLHVWQTTPNGTWSGFAGLGGPTATDAGTSTAVNADGRLEIFTTGTDGRVWHVWQTKPNGGWSGVWALDGRGGGTPSAARRSDGRVVVAVVDEVVPTRAQTSAQVVPNGGWGPWSFIG